MTDGTDQATQATTTRDRKRKRTIIAAVIAVVLLAAIGIGIAVANQPPTTPEPLTPVALTEPAEYPVGEIYELVTDQGIIQYFYNVKKVGDDYEVVLDETGTPEIRLYKIKATGTEPVKIPAPGTLKGAPVGIIDFASVERLIAERAGQAEPAGSATTEPASAGSATTETSPAVYRPGSITTTQTAIDMDEVFKWAKASDEEWAAEVIRLTNEIRVGQGLEPFARDATLDLFAAIRAQYNVEFGSLTHLGPGGVYGPGMLCQQYGLDPRLSGENAHSGKATPERTVEGWMNSPGHRSAMLNDDQYVGFGMAEDEVTGQVYMILFGYGAGASSPQPAPASVVSPETVLADLAQQTEPPAEPVEPEPADPTEPEPVDPEPVDPTEPEPFDPEPQSPDTLEPTPDDANVIIVDEPSLGIEIIEGDPNTIIDIGDLPDEPGVEDDLVVDTDDPLYIEPIVYEPVIDEDGHVDHYTPVDDPVIEDIKDGEATLPAPDEPEPADPTEPEPVDPAPDDTPADPGAEEGETEGQTEGETEGETEGGEAVTEIPPVIGGHPVALSPEAEQVIKDFIGGLITAGQYDSAKEWANAMIERYQAVYSEDLATYLTPESIQTAIDADYAVKNPPEQPSTPSTPPAGNGNGTTDTPPAGNGNDTPSTPVEEPEPAPEVEYVIVPNLIGLTPMGAENRILDFGLIPYSLGGSGSVVINQNPGAGQSVPIGTRIYFSF